MKEYRFTVVVGTRPGIIKMSPLIRTLQEQSLSHFVIHTGQHYSAEMDDVFMRELGITSDVFRVSDSHKKTLHGEKTAHMLAGVEEVLYREKPGVVLVCGDANTNLAAGLAARKLHIILGHVESGLRSWDWRMPEEHNRVMLDHISELLFAPTEECVENLQRESVRGEIHLTGNTIVDALNHNYTIAEKKSHILETLGLKKNQYMLLTAHREENVDSKENLQNILKGIKEITDTYNYDVVFPIHPRTKKRIDSFNLRGNVKRIKNFNIIDVVGYFDFLSLLGNAKLVLTDSGGIQEESCILKVPCVTLRDNTERPETVEVGANCVAGVMSKGIMKSVKKMINVDGAENAHGAYVVAPEVEKKETAHFILKVTDKGTPPLSRYKRIIVKILPN